MTAKPKTEKEKAHMLFKRYKAGMELDKDEMKLMMRHYGHLFEVKVIPDY